jgi:hypothetical protein
MSKRVSIAVPAGEFCAYLARGRRVHGSLSGPPVAVETDMPVDNNVGGVSSIVWSESCASRDLLFVDMLRAFRRSGGLAREAEIVDRRCRARSAGVLTGSLLDPIICFEWGGSLWLPRFQFDQVDMSRRAAPARVIAELSPVFDGWALATWFAQPNVWLSEQRPIDLIDDCLTRVLGAARADRFIAAG